MTRFLPEGDWADEQHDEQLGDEDLHLKARQENFRLRDRELRSDLVQRGSGGEVRSWVISSASSDDGLKSEKAKVENLNSGGKLTDENSNELKLKRCFFFGGGGDDGRAEIGRIIT